MARTILIVDDDAFERVGIRSIGRLEERGFRIIGEAENGQKGLEMARSLHPDIIISDVRMPIMNGLELMKACAEEAIGARFILLSSYDDFEYVREAFRSGAVDYILKYKLDENVLMDALLKVCGTQEPDAEDAVRYDTEAQPAGAFDGNLRAAMVVRLLQSDGSSHTEDDAARLSVPMLNVSEEISSRFPGCTSTKIDRLSLAFVMPFPILSIDRATLEGRASELLSAVSHMFRYILNGTVVMGVSGYALSRGDVMRIVEEARQLSLSTMREGRCMAASDEDLPSDEALAMIGRLSSLLGDPDGSGAVASDQAMTRLIEDVSASGLAAFDIGFIQLAVAQLLEAQGLDAASEGLAVTKKQLIDELYILRSRLCRREGSSDVISRARAYISAHFSEPISLASVADGIGVSSSYLSRKFFSVTGEKFVDYIARLRMTKAKELLASTDMRIYEVATAVGYDNNTYFCYLFRKRIGMTPQEYRQMAADGSR